MARISSYDQDGTLNKLDKVLGTDSITGDTKNYTINSMLQLVNTEGLVEAFDGASFAFVDYIASADNPRGVINLNAGVASPANFSDINEIYISTVDKTGLSIVEYLDNSLNNQIKISLKGNMNQFGIYEVTAIVDHDNAAYKRLTLTPRAHNGLLTVQDDFFLSNYSAVFDQDFSNDSVTEFGDVHHAGSGRIITNEERTSLTNFTNNGLVHGDVVDNVTSTATDVPLSANQGKILKGLINDINTLLTSDNVNLDTLQEVVDFIEANRESLNTLAISNIAGLQNALDAKQNAEAGKGLSANDFTDILLNKLNNISANAEVNVNADWTATTGDAQILNKPTDVTDLSQHSVTELNNVTNVGSGAIISSAERTKLTDINVNITNRTVTDGTTSIVVPPANAEQNVNADWDATTGDAQILNKPTLAPSNAEPNVQADWSVTDTASSAFILNKPALAPVNAEQNVQADWNETNTSEDAFILNKPDVSITKAKIDTALGTGSADDTYFYRGDGQWALPSAAIAIGDLTDVDGSTTNPGVNVGHVITWVPAMNKWIGTSLSLENLYNVRTNQQNSVGQVLAVTSFNAQSSVNTYDAVELDSSYFGDFDINTPEDKQILQYNSASSHWENVTNLQLPGTLEFTATETNTPSFDNGIYISTDDGHNVMHFRYHGHDLSIDYLTQVLPTGILNGGVLSKANNTQFTIAAGDGVINDLNKGANTDPHPEIIKVSWAEQTITVSNLDANDTDQLNSWIYVDNTGTVQQQATAFTDAQKKSNIIIGSAIHSEGVIKFVKTFPHTGYNNASQMNEFAGIFGPMKKSGHRITANGANLSIDREAGVSFVLGRNYANDPENPSTISDAAKTQCVIHRYHEDGNGGFVLDDGLAGAGYTALDPSNYDDGSGTLVPVSNGHYSVQRLYYFPDTPDIIVSYYGKDEYNSLDVAEKSYNLEDFTEAPNTSDQAIYVGAIILAGGATDLTNASEAKFLTAGSFRGLAAVTVGGAIAGSSLNDLSDVNIQSVANNEVLRYSSSTQQWENVSDSILPITLDTANNRVGINQTTPTHDLHVVGTANITGATTIGGDITANNLNIANWDTAYGWGDHSAAGYLTTHPTISAATTSTNYGRTYVQSLTLDANGHILGITTATETVANTDTIDMGDGFKIQNSSGADQFTIQENDGLRITGSGNTSVNFDSATSEVTISSSLSPITLDTTNNRVGIGTTSPTHTLHVAGNSYIDATSASATLTLGRYSGQPSIKAGTDDSGYMLIDSSGGKAGINWYSDDDIILGLGGGKVGVRTSTPAVSLDINGTDAIALPIGTTAQRPSSPVAGMFRYNTTESQFEGYTTEWGAIAGGGGGASNITRTSFSGDDSTTQFSLSENIADEANTQIYIGGVYQEKTTYSVSGQQITFSEAPPEGTNNIEVIHMASVTVDGASGITRNTYTGTGSQQSFTLSVTPSSEDFTFVYVDGVYADKNEYTLNNNVITFVSAPANNASVEVMTINAVNIQQTSYLANDTFTGDDSTTTFALVNGQPSNEAFTMVFVQGVYQNKNTYSLSSNSIVFTEAPYTGDSIEVISINGGGVKTLPPTTVDDIRYNVEVINTNTTAQTGYVYVFTGNLTLTLPALPKIGQSIKISNRSGVDTCVLGAGGNKIMGSTDNLTLDTASASFELIYSGNDEGWVIIGQ